MGGISQSVSKWATVPYRDSIRSVIDAYPSRIADVIARNQLSSVPYALGSVPFGPLW
jgi:hypothetical protein